MMQILGDKSATPLSPLVQKTRPYNEVGSTSHSSYQTCWFTWAGLEQACERAQASVLAMVPGRLGCQIEGMSDVNLIAALARSTRNAEC